MRKAGILLYPVNTYSQSTDDDKSYETKLLELIARLSL